MSADIRQALLRFSLDAHRIQLVLTAGGVGWVNDSKATNPHAADASLGAYPSVVWIVGGLLKGVDVGDLVSRHADRLRGAVVIGADRADVLIAFQRHAPDVPIFEVRSDDTEDVMTEAVELASGLAASGDVVLLAPAAASMDQFADYAERGRRFTEAVQERWGGLRDERPDDQPPA